MVSRITIALGQSKEITLGDLGFDPRHPAFKVEYTSTMDGTYSYTIL